MSATRSMPQTYHHICGHWVYWLRVAGSFHISDMIYTARYNAFLSNSTHKYSLYGINTWFCTLLCECNTWQMKQTDIIFIYLRRLVHNLYLNQCAYCQFWQSDVYRDILSDLHHRLIPFKYVSKCPISKFCLVTALYAHKKSTCQSTVQSLLFVCMWQG